jgi:hypothetical protein
MGKPRPLAAGVVVVRTGGGIHSVFRFPRPRLASIQPGNVTLFSNRREQQSVMKIRDGFLSFTC